MINLLFELPGAIVVFLLGISIGSFLNVVVYRLPAGLSLVHPPSRCPACLTPLRKRENLPIVGWLLLKGRCAHCGVQISARYPIVEAAIGLLFLLTYLMLGWSVACVGYWLFFSLLFVLALIDFDTMLLDLRLMKGGVILGLLFQVILGWVSTHTVTGAILHLIQGIVGAVLGIWLLDIISVIGAIAFQREAMGAGDAKLAAMMGAWLGWKLMLLAGFLACLIGVIVGGSAIAIGSLRRYQRMPFGPFLAVGSLIAALWGDRLLASYLTLFFPTW